MGAISEDDLIARFFAPIAGPGALGLKDDAACLTPPPGCDLILTKDALVAGVHFFSDDPPEAIARKALRVNVSDLAAKGADPLGFLLAIALPIGVETGWIEAFARGLGEDALRWSIPLLGGDTVKTPGPAMVSVTALGTTPTGHMVPRTGVRAGDLIFASGTIGDSALGLQVRLAPQRFAALSHGARAHLLARYLDPQPRLALAPVLRDHAGAGMDVSDGLVGDLTKMLKASGVSAIIRLCDAPLSDAAREAIAMEPALFETAMTGGDDYELLVATSPQKAKVLQEDARAAGVPLTLIGEAVAGAGQPQFIGADGAQLVFARGSFSHF
jgi:thiamine-monophosphate kinase